jgi:hypothetical protein
MANHELVPTTESLEARLSLQQIEDRRTAIMQLMKKVMRKGIDYGRIPGAPKPSLLKPGAEKICSMFQLSNRISTTDLSTVGEVRYEAKVQLFTPTGVMVGEGMGTASSHETKYKWRAALCKEEWEATSADCRRLVYKKDGRGGIYQIAQIRTEEADQANTVLKMAVKRAHIAATLAATGCSDIFTQDFPDVDEDQAEGEGDESNGNGNGEEEEPPRQAPPAKKPAPAQAPPPAARQAQPTAANRSQPQAPVITQPQMARFWAIAKKSGHEDEAIKRYLKARFGIEHSRDLRRDQYDEACMWAASLTPQEEERNFEEEDPQPDDDEVF